MLNLLMLFSWSLIDSITTRLRNKILSINGMSRFFMFFLHLVISCRPCSCSCVNNAWKIQLLSPKSLSIKSLVRFATGSQSSTKAGISLKVSNSPRSLITRCSLKPQHQPERVFAPSHFSFKHFMGVRPTPMADFQWSRINETDACDLTCASVQVAAQRHQTPGHQLHKTIEADSGESLSQQGSTCKVQKSLKVP